MGMTIEERIAQLVRVKHYASPSHYETLDVAIETMRKYQMMQADYEARLKADMIAMLEDLDLQIDESAAYNLEVAKVQRLIRDRIDKLRENNNDN